MNLVEKLLAVDKGEFDKIETKKLKSKQLSKIVGEDAEVTIQAVDGDLFGGLSASGLDEEGEVDYGRAFSTNAKIAAAGIVDPNLKNEELLKHLGVATPADAAKKIFKGEINRISTEIAKLSGFDDEEKTDKEVKKLIKSDREVQMDYLHYRFKNWKPFEYMNLPEGQKRIARAYMRQELRDKEERNKEIEKAFGGGG